MIRQLTFDEVLLKQTEGKEELNALDKLVLLYSPIEKEEEAVFRQVTGDAFQLILKEFLVTGGGRKLMKMAFDFGESGIVEFDEFYKSIGGSNL